MAVSNEILTRGHFGVDGVDLPFVEPSIHISFCDPDLSRQVNMFKAIRREQRDS